MTMQNGRRIDGIYRQDVTRRFPERRLVVPARPSVRPAVQPAAGPVQKMVAITDIHRTVIVSNQAPVVAAPQPTVIQEVITQVATTSRKPRLANMFIISAVCFILLGTGILAVQTWRTNAQAKQAYSSEPTTGTTSTTGEASDAPSEAPVSDKSKQAYTVAADMPRTISIDRVGVHARVLRMSVGTDGAIEAPKSIWDAGWYDGSAKPGEPGNAFIDGHISGPTMDAVFAKLKVLKAGDYITVERGDGKSLTYSVTSITTVKIEDINMASVLAGPTGVKESLTLMTCGGNYKGNYTYDSRVIVVAKRVS